MDEKGPAPQPQRTKDDADEWGEAKADPDNTDPTVASRAESAPRRRLAAMVSVRLSPEELEAVQARAFERGESVSGYLRGVALRDVTLVKRVFRMPAIMSTSDPYVVQIVGSPIVTDGGRLPTRTS
jgi:hypothetical protein